MYTQKFVPKTPRALFAAAAMAVTTALSLGAGSLFGSAGATSVEVATVSQTTYSEGRVTVTALRPVHTAGVKQERTRS